MTSPHSLTTRLLHGALAIAVGFQLTSSLIMQVPSDHHAGNIFFELHKDSGIFVAMLVVLFWTVLATRPLGTQAGLLFPWFRAGRRAALVADVKRHGAALRHKRLPAFQDASPLAAASHGLGLVLVTVMATTGVLWESAKLANLSDQPAAGLLLGLHSLTSTFVWAYLIGHGLMALHHHYSGAQPLRTMWSLGALGLKDDPHRNG